jgi:hypothetical protein
MLTARSYQVTIPSIPGAPIRGDHELVAIKPVIAKAWGGRTRKRIHNAEAGGFAIG